MRMVIFFHLVTQNTRDFIQQKVSKTIKQNYPESMTNEQRSEANELAHTAIILHYLIKF